MSTTQADELLDNLTSDDATLGSGILGTMLLGLDAYQEDMHEHITIGADREIVVPKAVRRIAVQYDHNIEVATFDCIRYWDNTDLSVMKICIEYIREDGVGGSTVAVNVVADEVDPSIMHFTWIVDRHMTQVSGRLRVKVCARKVDAYGYEENHWNTEINTDMYVSEGFESHELIKEAYPDEFQQILNRMDELDESATNALNEANSVNELVTEKVAEVEGLVAEAKEHANDAASSAEEAAKAAAAAAESAKEASSVSGAVVDSALSTDSLNPVQNKVIAAKLEELDATMGEVYTALANINASIESTLGV